MGEQVERVRAWSDPHTIRVTILLRTSTCRDPSPYGDTDNCFALLIAFATKSKKQQARETDDTRRPS